MLPRLLHREWLLHRQVLMIMFGIFGLYQIWAMTQMESSRVWAVFATLYAAFLTVVVFAREDKFRADAWSCSLPVTRRELVRGRFVVAWLMVVVGLASAILLTAVVPGSQVSALEVLEPSNLLIIFAVSTLVFGWIFPFTIRFGMVGVMIFLVGGQVLGIAALVLARTVSSSKRPIRALFGAIGDGIVATRDALGPMLFFVATVLVLIAANWMIYRLSAWLYARREL